MLPYVGVEQNHAEDGISATRRKMLTYTSILKQKNTSFERSKLQSEAFREEIRSIRENRALSKKSSLVKLNPVLDHDCILRVGGQLMKSELKVTGKKSCHYSWQTTHSYTVGALLPSTYQTSRAPLHTRLN